MDMYPLILIANEPRTYRSLLASELPFLRHNLRILEIDPAEVETALISLHPAVLLWSGASEHVRDAEVTLLVLRLDAGGTFLHSAEGTISNPRLSDILAAIDQAVSARTS